MNSMKYNRGFTLTEMMIAAALSVMVATMVLTLLVKNMGAWREGMARLELSEQSRFVRERVLHGMDGKYGLRHALRSGLVFTEHEILFSDVAGTNPIILTFEPGRPPVWTSAAGTNAIARAGIFVEDVEIARVGNILNIDLTLALIQQDRTYAQPQRIRAYLLNDQDP